MNALIVLAHPERQSYNAALAQAALESLVARGAAVRISDLYARRFEPDEHARHFPQRKNPMRFDAQSEQRFNAKHATLPADVQREIDGLLWADFVVLQFPLWWFGMPAILKGWMDRIYSGSRRFHAGVCRGKRVMLSVTAGSSAEACMHNGQEGDTRLIVWPIQYALHYLGFTVLEPSLITGVWGSASEDDAVIQHRYLEAQLQNYRSRLMNLEKVPTVLFNSQDDWDERRKLKPTAPVYSPFIRQQADLCLS